MNHLVDLYDDWLLHLWSFLFRNALQILRGSPDNPWENSPGFSKILRDCLGLSRTFFFRIGKRDRKRLKEATQERYFLGGIHSSLSLSLYSSISFCLSSVCMACVNVCWRIDRISQEGSSCYGARAATVNQSSASINPFTLCYSGSFFNWDSNAFMCRPACGRVLHRWVPGSGCSVGSLGWSLARSLGVSWLAFITWFIYKTFSGSRCCCCYCPWSCRCWFRAGLIRCATCGAHYHLFTARFLIPPRIFRI